MDNNIDISDLDRLNISSNSDKIIKVIGVGGGGSNAVAHMYKQGIHDVSFVLCNTDNQALAESEIPTKIQLGKMVTNGLGAGNKPHIAEKAALESKEDITELFNDGTKMVFITAGMGGGTGTGAAPIIANIAKNMEILTVGIVTIPFLFEGEKKIIQALEGVEKLAKNVDALLVINNERLRDIYGDLGIKEAFSKADDTLTVAAKSIAEIITLRGDINLDFADVETTLKDGGVAIMSTGMAKGKERIPNAIENALNSPLLNNNDIYNAKKIMLNIYCNENVKMDEIRGIDNFMAQFEERSIEVIWGMNYLKEFKDEVKVTILATGFGVDDIPGYSDNKQKISAQEQEQLFLEEKRKEEINDKKIQQAYGASALYFRKARTRKKNQIFIFNANDLDNDEIIAMVEEVSTYERTASRLRRIQTVSSQNLLPPEQREGADELTLKDKQSKSEQEDIITF